MKLSPAKHLPRILTSAVAALLCGAPVQSARAGTFTWANTTGGFSDNTKWIGGSAPSGLDPTDILIFGGSVGTTLANTSYIATSNSLTNPFLINQLLFQATNATPGTGPVDNIGGFTPIRFTGTTPSFTQTGTASLVVDAPIQLGTNLTLTGNTVANDPAHDKAMITLNGAVSGNYDITKNGTSTFRFGSVSPTGNAPSDNTWFGTLTINEGTMRFNNNAFTAPTALRSNPVVLNSATALLTTQFKPIDSTVPTPSGKDPESSLRMGTLSGTAGTVEARRETATASVFDSADMTITALQSGSFAGTLRNVQAGGSNSGTLKIRGVGTQTFTGTLDLAKDVQIGDIATLVMAGDASLSSQAAGAIILGGGTMRLDNTATNTDRLRDGTSTSTGLETIGGGTFSLVGNAAGTTENVARLQLGTSGNSRSGALTLSIVHSAAAGVTNLNLQSYSRDTAGNPYDTVNFTAANGSGTAVALGAAGTTGARVTFNTILGTPFVVPVFNGLLGNTTAGADASTVGWATVNGADFASYSTNGVIAATTVAPPVGTGSGTASANIAVTSSLSLSNATGYAVNSIKMAPTAAGQSITLASAGNLTTSAFLLAGSTDFSINSTAGGLIGNSAGTAPRYFHVSSAMLTVNAGLSGAQAAIVKSGAGTLVLTNAANNTVTQPVIINEGTLRATPGTSLPAGELRFRGGVLEITGGGTFTRTVGLGTGNITWSGIDGLGQSVGQEQGSGGFAAVGADAIVDLTPASGSDFTWEDTGFVNSGHALLFGSTRADAKVTWVDNISLTAFAQVANYNARHFRAIDNAASNNDVAVLSGTISGTVRNDFLKTGGGELVLTGNNTFAGATLVTDGTLRVNGSTATSFLTDVRDTGTLGGNGTVAGVQVEGTGTLSPGDANAHGSILNTSDLRFLASGAKLRIEIGGTTAGGDSATGYDRVNVTGGVTLSGAQLTGTLLGSFIATPADLFFIILNDGSDAVQGSFAQVASVTMGAQTFAISYAGNFTGNAATNSFTGGNDVVLRLVPEPGTATLLILGALAAGLRRRRR